MASSGLAVIEAVDLAATKFQNSRSMLFSIAIAGPVFLMKLFAEARQKLTCTGCYSPGYGMASEKHIVLPKTV